MFSYDLDLDLMTLILKLDLDMVKMYLHTKNEVSMLRGSTQTHRQTDTQTDMTENITYPRVVIIVSHNGVFTQSDTDSYTNTDTDRIGLY